MVWSGAAPSRSNAALAASSSRGLSRPRFASARELAELAELGYAEGGSPTSEEPWYDQDSR